MKKTILIIIVAISGIFILPSCKKSYTCICTEGSGSSTVSKEYDLGSQTKKDAQADCDNKAYNYTKGNGVVCKLK